MHALTRSSEHTENLPLPLLGAELGFVTGGVRWALRLAAFAAFAAAVAVYAYNGFSWPIFALLILAPDLPMLAYVAGPRTGAIAYNLAHSVTLALALALALTLAGFFCGTPLAIAAGLIWIAHIGFDRALGYGIKYPTGFGDTHLGHIRRR